MKSRHWLFLAVYLLGLMFTWVFTRNLTLSGLILGCVLSAIVLIVVIVTTKHIPTVLWAVLQAIPHVLTIRLLIVFYQLYLAGVFK